MLRLIWLSDVVSTASSTVDALSPLDLFAIVVYLVGLAAVTVYVNRNIGGSDTECYFLGGRGLPFWAIGMSLFASNLGTDHLVGLAGSGAASGLAVGNYEWSACYALLILGWVFVPHYFAYRIFTVPEYLEKRFGRSFRIFFTWLSIAATILTKISVTIFAGAVVMKEVMGWNQWVSSIALLTLTAVYTSIGGLAAVVYTEVLQSAILIVGSATLLWYGFSAVGGWSGLQSQLPASHFTLMKPLDHPDFPWLGVILGMPINSIWYWCTDQVMVQRTLAAKSVEVGQNACVFAAWLKITPMFLMVVPGLIAAALYPEEIQQDSNRAFALLVTRLLPLGWRGPMIAVMLSSFMAALASCFNSCSTLFTMDIYARWVPDHSEDQLVRVGRIFTVLLACASLAWLPMIAQGSDQLFLYIQEMQVIWCSPVAVVFLGSVALERLTGWAASVALAVGLCFGLGFWIERELVPEEWQIAALRTLNILHFAIALFLIDAIVLLLAHQYEMLKEKVSEEVPFVSKKEYIRSIEKQQWSGSATKMLAGAVVITAAALTIAFS